MVKSNKIIAWLLVIALMIASVAGVGDVTAFAAGADVKLSKKSVSLSIQKSKSGMKYGTAKVKIKKGKGIKVKKVSCKVKKKSIAKVSVKGKSVPTLTVKAKKKGSTKVTVSVRYTKAGKTKTKKLTLNVKVMLKVKENNAVTTKPTIKPTITPALPNIGDETRDPGIYNSKTGKLEKTWSEALAENMITMDSNGMIISSSGVSSYSGEWIEYIDLVLSNEVRGIKAGAFGTQIECGLYLDKISIPASVHIIEKGAFGYFSFNDIGVENSIKVDSGNPIYDSRNNCNAIIKTDTNELVIGCSRTVIPENVTAIWDFAFSGCSNLKSIVIPNTVSSIGDSAFAGCTSLSSIHIPNKVSYIGNDAFSGYTMVSITVDSKNPIYDSRDNCNAIIKTGSNELMLGCQNTIIPNSVVSIGDRAFVGCSDLESITIPESVVNIGDRVFAGCSGLKSIIIIPESVTNIGEGAFYGCDSLKDIMIPKSVANIEANVFYGCSSLTSVSIPNGVARIGKSAFEYCNNLTSVTISNGVVCISERAFSDCESLVSIEIPESVTNIEEEAFSGCNALSNIVVDSKNSIYDSRENCNAIIETATNSLIKGSSKTIIPNGVTSIRENAFNLISRKNYTHAII